MALAVGVGVAFDSCNECLGGVGDGLSERSSARTASTSSMDLKEET